MSRIIKLDDNIDCDECKYLKYESDIDTQVCISKGGCDRRCQDNIQ